MAYRRFPRPAAFTLVELLVVIGIIALLISILLPTLGAAKEQARTTQCASNMRQLATALVNYATENKGRFPTNINVYKPTPPAGQPSAGLWYDLDRIGRYLPKGVIPSDTSTNPTIGGTVFVCPGDFDKAQRSYAMNIWASSQTDQFSLNFSPEVRTYATDPYVPQNPPRGTYWDASTKGSADLMLLLEGHARNSTPRGFYANSTVGLAPTAPDDAKPGRRFAGMTGYQIGFDNYGGGVYPAWRSDTQLAWFKHRSKKDRNRPAYETVGRTNIAFADGHVETLSLEDLVDPVTKKSRLRKLWSPYDRQINN